MKCPIDQATLLMNQRSGIEIDYCPECRGVWLDRGELEKILDREQEPVASRHEAPKAREDQRSFDALGYRSGQPHKKRKESFLGDLFDF